MADFKIVKTGNWIFTCDMLPLQFKKFTQGDSFETIEGSSHSVANCGLKIVSEAYAKWFIENNISDLFSQFVDLPNRWELYEKAIKEKCEIDKIKFEGF